MFDSEHLELLIIDVQERLYTAMPEGDLEGGRERAVRAINNLAYAFHALEAPITLTEQYPKGLGPTLAALDLPPHRRFEKLAFSAVREPEIPPPTRPTVVLAGMEAHICVALTALDLRNRGFAVCIAADACLSRRPEDRALAFALLRQAECLILPSETILFGMAERAGTPIFKEISRRIR